ncbi:MAG: hypothetical protein R2568_11315, partial [Candidatus Scalindua sp.]|nr:hypothetical protein [Candidatus Scalindua sp.]
FPNVGHARYWVSQDQLKGIMLVLLMTDVETFRIEAQYYEDDLVETVVNQYRKRMDLLMENPTVFYPLPEAEWKDLVEKSPKELSLCAYSQNVTYSRSTLEVMKTATQAN